MPELRICHRGRLEKRKQRTKPGREQRESEHAEVQSHPFVAGSTATSICSGLKTTSLVWPEMIEARTHAHSMMPGHGEGPPNDSTQNPLPNGQGKNIALLREDPGHQESAD